MEPDRENRGGNIAPRDVHYAEKVRHIVNMVETSAEARKYVTGQTQTSLNACNEMDWKYDRGWDGQAGGQPSGCKSEALPVELPCYDLPTTYQTP